jgi:hypothetical protein
VVSPAGGRFRLPHPLRARAARRQAEARRLAELARRAGLTRRTSSDWTAEHERRRWTR